MLYVDEFKAAFTISIYPFRCEKLHTLYWNTAQAYDLKPGNSNVKYYLDWSLDFLTLASLIDREAFGTV